jgi:hypothetical protein
MVTVQDQKRLFADKENRNVIKMRSKPDLGLYKLSIYPMK